MQCLKEDSVLKGIHTGGKDKGKVPVANIGLGTNFEPNVNTYYRYIICLTRENQQTKLNLL